MKVYFSGTDSVRDCDTLKNEGVCRVLYTYADVQGKADFPFDFEDIMLDSGAWSNFTGSSKISVEAYSLWLELYLKKYPQITRYVALDDIKSHDNSMKNLEYMIKNGLKPMPTFHYGEPVELLDELCGRFQYVGLGGVAARSLDAETIKKWWEFVYERYPKTQFHVFAVGTLTPFVKYQPYSTDSTVWLVGAQYGALLCYKDGVPSSTRELSRSNGYTVFFTRQEILGQNIRVMLDWEKMEWVKTLSVNDDHQTRLF